MKHSSIHYYSTPEESAEAQKKADKIAKKLRFEQEEKEALKKISGVDLAISCMLGRK